MAQVACKSKSFSCELIRASMARQLGGSRACGRIMPGLPTHLVQELNVAHLILKHKRKKY